MRCSFRGRVENSNDIHLYHTHIKVPREIHIKFKNKNIKRIVFTLNNKQPNHGGFIAYGDGSYFLMASKKLLKENNLRIGEEVLVELWADTSKYGMPICEEFKELLNQDLEGSKLFHELTDGKIRSLLYKVNNYKSGHKKLEKAIIILDHLKGNKGQLDWKMLNEAFKMGINL